MIRASIASALIGIVFAVPAFAQGDPMVAAHAAAANQLGILEYCQSKGAVGDDAIAAQKDVITHLPASTIDTTAAESVGKSGTLAIPNGQTMTLDSVASGQHSTVPDVCKQLGASALRSSAMYKQMGSSGVPGMPSGMPAMPGGMPSGIPRWNADHAGWDAKRHADDARDAEIAASAVSGALDRVIGG